MLQLAYPALLLLLVPVYVLYFHFLRSHGKQDLFRLVVLTLLVIA